MLHEPLKGCSAFEAALFLRFCYQPEDMTPACLEAARGSLPALLRLAHKLEVERMLASVAQHMTGGCRQVYSLMQALLRCRSTQKHC